MTDHCSGLLFTVSENCRNRLLKERIPENIVHLVGDTMYESIVQHRDEINEDRILEKIGLDEDYYVLTAHRAENVDNPTKLKDIIKTVQSLGKNIVFPCHPRTRNKLESQGLLDFIAKDEDFNLLEPVSYFSMLKLVKEAEIVLTDSGGIQKEAFWLDTPCVTLRENTEWMETIEQGMNVIVGANPEKIQNAVEIYETTKPSKKGNPYEFGGASENIIKIIKEKL